MKEAKFAHFFPKRFSIGLRCAIILLTTGKPQPLLS